MLQLMLILNSRFNKTSTGGKYICKIFIIQAQSIGDYTTAFLQGVEKATKEGKRVSYAHLFKKGKVAGTFEVHFGSGTAFYIIHQTLKEVLPFPINLVDVSINV